MPTSTDAGATHRSVVVYLAVNLAQLVSLAIAAWATGSAALRAQTATNAAEVAVEIFLLVGVLSSDRPPDDTHPLGYGREGFFWSLFAALGIFIGGGGLGLEQAISAALRPTPVHSFPVAYLVLGPTVLLDLLALRVASRPVLRHAGELGISIRRFLRRSTDPTAVTVIVSGGCAVLGGLVAAMGLVLSEALHSPTPDTVASAFIGMLLLVASVLLLQTNRNLLTGRGVPLSMLQEMRQVVVKQTGVVDVPDLFSVVIGPASLIVDGDVTFVDQLDVPAVEQSIAAATAALKQRWPSIEYVYLTPAPKARRRRGPIHHDAPSLAPSQPGSAAGGRCRRPARSRWFASRS